MRRIGNGEVRPALASVPSVGSTRATVSIGFLQWGISTVFVACAPGALLAAAAAPAGAAPPLPVSCAAGCPGATVAKGLIVPVVIVEQAARETLSMAQTKGKL